MVSFPPSVAASVRVASLLAAGVGIFVIFDGNLLIIASPEGA